MVDYWLNLFTRYSPETWEETCKRDFRGGLKLMTYFSPVPNIQPGDFLVCYVTRLSRFCGIPRAKSHPRKPDKKANQIWRHDWVRERPYHFVFLIDVDPLIVRARTAPYLVVRGMDNRIYYRCYNCVSDSWGDWDAIPTGATCDSPSATLVDNELRLCIRGEGGEDLWFGIKDLETSSWTGWTPILGSTPSAPTLTSDGSKTYLVVRGLDNQVWYNAYDGSTWTGWMGTLFPGGTNTSPAATAYKGELQMIVTDNMYYLWHTIVELPTCEWSTAWWLTSGSTSGPPTLTCRGESF